MQCSTASASLVMRPTCHEMVPKQQRLQLRHALQHCAVLEDMASEQLPLT